MNDKYTDLEEVVQQIREGTLTEDAAAKILARRALVDQTVAKMAISARLFALDKSPVITRQSGVSSSQRSVGGAVPGSVFGALLTKYGLNQTQTAKIIGRSPSRVHELVTRGGSVGLFERFSDQLQAWANAQSD